MLVLKPNLNHHLFHTNSYLIAWKYYYFTFTLFMFFILVTPCRTAENHFTPQFTRNHYHLLCCFYILLMVPSSPKIAPTYTAPWSLSSCALASQYPASLFPSRPSPSFSLSSRYFICQGASMINVYVGVLGYSYNFWSHWQNGFQINFFGRLWELALVQFGVDQPMPMTILVGSEYLPIAID